MKFLLFNLIVGFALVYLFTVDQDPARNLVDKALEARNLIQDRAQDKTGTIMNDDRENASSVVHPILSEKDTASLGPSKQDEESSEMLPEARVQSLPPEVAKRKQEILEPDVSSAQNTTRTNNDRRQSLMRLAEEMELYSLEATSR